MAAFGVDIARVSADSEQAFKQMDIFKRQLITPQKFKLDGVEECNGYWHQIAGMSVA